MRGFKEDLRRYTKINEKIEKNKTEKVKLEALKSVFDFSDGDEFRINRHENFRDFHGATVAGENHEFKGKLPEKLREDIANRIGDDIVGLEKEIKRLYKDKKELEDS